MKVKLALLLLAILHRVPLPVLYWLAWLPAIALYLLPWRKHRVIRHNLEIAFPGHSPGQRRALHLRNLVAMVRLIFESGVVWHADRSRLEKLVRNVHGWEHVEQAQQAGRGVLLIGGHLGNWEIDALYVGLRVPFYGLYKAPRDPAVDAAVTRSRSRFGARLIAAGSPAMRDMLRALRAGGVVGVLMDQQPRQGEGVFAPFFGRPALTMTLVHRLARHTRCAVILTGSRRLRHGRGWEIQFKPLTEQIAEAGAQGAAATMNRALEERIKGRPEDYLWLYKRFALQPTGMDNPYS